MLSDESVVQADSVLAALAKHLEANLSFGESRFITRAPFLKDDITSTSLYWLPVHFQCLKNIFFYSFKYIAGTLSPYNSCVGGGLLGVMLLHK